MAVEDSLTWLHGQKMIFEICWAYISIQQSCQICGWPTSHTTHWYFPNGQHHKEWQHWKARSQL